MKNITIELSEAHINLLNQLQKISGDTFNKVANDTMTMGAILMLDQSQLFKEDELGPDQRELIVLIEKVINQEADKLDKRK
jgi:hypothetical protein